MNRLSQNRSDRLVTDLMNRPATRQGDRFDEQTNVRLANKTGVTDLMNWLSQDKVIDRGEDYFVVVNRSGYT